MRKITFLTVAVISLGLSGCDDMLGPYVDSRGLIIKIKNTEPVPVLVENHTAFQPVILEPGDLAVIELDYWEIDPRVDRITIVASEVNPPAGCNPRVDEEQYRFPREGRGWTEERLWEIDLGQYVCVNTHAGLTVHIINESCGPVDVKYGSELLIDNLASNQGDVLTFERNVLDEVVLYATTSGNTLPDGCEGGVETENFSFHDGDHRVYTWRVRL